VVRFSPSREKEQQMLQLDLTTEDGGKAAQRSPSVAGVVLKESKIVLEVGVDIDARLATVNVV